MFRKFELPSPPCLPRLILAWNREAILERLKSGQTMMMAYRELLGVMERSGDNYPGLVYTTFMRFVSREKIKDTVQIPKADGAQKTTFSADSPQPQKKHLGYPVRDVTQPAQGGEYPPALDPRDF